MFLLIVSYFLNLAVVLVVPLSKHRNTPNVPRIDPVSCLAYAYRRVIIQNIQKRGSLGGINTRFHERETISSI